MLTGAPCSGQRGRGGGNRLQLKTRQTGPQKCLKGTAPSRTNQKLWPGVHALRDEALPRPGPRLRPQPVPTPPICAPRAPRAHRLPGHPLPHNYAPTGRPSVVLAARPCPSPTRLPALGTGPGTQGREEAEPKNLLPKLTSLLDFPPGALSTPLTLCTQPKAL